MKPSAALGAGIAAVICLSTPVRAGGADVIGVSFERMGEVMSFEVTIAHEDEGPHHFADRFEVVGLDGTVHAIRKLAHPHVEEQPFTRVLGGVRLPVGIGGEIIVRARDTVHGYDGQAFVVKTRKSYACGVPEGSGITPPVPEPVSGRLQCPLHPPARPTGAKDPE